MKKTLIGISLVVVFVLGVALSDLILSGINAILGKEIFTTHHTLEQQMAKNRQDYDAELTALKTKNQEMADKMTRQQAGMNSLIQEIDTRVTPDLIKEILLTPPASPAKDNQILLNTPNREALLNPSAIGEPLANEFKRSFNDKAKTIIQVSRGILKEKISQLNHELMRINNELTDRNVELISKLREVEQYKQELDEQRKYIRDLEGIKNELQETVGVLETKIENGRLKVSFKGDILFASGKHQLRVEGQQLLDSVFPILQKSTEQNDIFIAGHTDNVPIRPDARDKYESNWTLSTYRAIEVVKYLVTKGMPPQSLTAAGYGEYKPLTDNTTDEGKSKNRRVELFLIPKIIKRDSSEPAAN